MLVALTLFRWTAIVTVKFVEIPLACPVLHDFRDGCYADVVHVNCFFEVTEPIQLQRKDLKWTPTGPALCIIFKHKRILLGIYREELILSWIGNAVREIKRVIFMK